MSAMDNDNLLDDWYDDEEYDEGDDLDEYDDEEDEFIEEEEEYEPRRDFWSVEQQRRSAIAVEAQQQKTPEELVQDLINKRAQDAINRRFGGEEMAQPIGYVEASETEQVQDLVNKMIEKKRAERVAQAIEAKKKAPDAKDKIQQLVKARHNEDMMRAGKMITKHIIVRDVINPHEHKQEYRLLYEGRFNKEPTEVREYPPAKRTIMIREGKRPGKARDGTIDKCRTVQFPYIVVAFQYNGGRGYRMKLFFAKEPVTKKSSSVYFPYISNVYEDGRICLTLPNNDFDKGFQSFWQSLFVPTELSYGPDLLKTTFKKKTFEEAMDVWEKTDLDGVMDTLTRAKKLSVMLGMRNFKLNGPEFKKTQDE